MIAELPVSGRYLVDTLDATYDLDVDARIGRVVIAPGDAAGLCEPEQTFAIQQVECRVGAPMRIDRFLMSQDDGLIVTAPVLGITPTRQEVPA